MFCVLKNIIKNIDVDVFQKHRQNIASLRKNTAKLYGDALVWTVVFIDWLDLFELVY